MTGIDRQALQAINEFTIPNLRQYGFLKAGWQNYARSNGYYVGLVSISPGIDEDLRAAVLSIPNSAIAEYLLRHFGLHGASGIDRKLLKVLVTLPMSVRNPAFAYLKWFRYAHSNYGIPMPPAGTTYTFDSSAIKAAVLGIIDPQIKAYARIRFKF